MVTLSVVIVNFNSADVLAQCLESMERFLPPGFQAIVVDNGSSADDVTCLRDLQDRFSSTPFIYLTENVGYGAANNAGIEHATGRYVLLLNPDTRLVQPGIDKLRGLLSGSVGLVACRLDNPDGTLQESLYRFPTLGVVVGQALLLHKILPASVASRFAFSRNDHDQQQTPDWVPGAFMLLERDTIKQLGGFDESIFMYGEDLDLCFRLRKLGLRIAFVPDYHVVHHGGHSQAQVWSDSEREVRVYRALFDFYRAHYGRGRLFAARIAWAIGALLRVIGYGLAAMRPMRGGRAANEAKTYWRVFLAQLGFDGSPRSGRRRIALAFCIAAIVLAAVGGFRWISASREPGVPVLIYHNVLPADPAARRGLEAGAPVITPKTFETHLAWLRANGFTTVTLEEVARFAEGRGTMPAKPVAITFDDGSEGVLTYALPLLRKYDSKAALFVISRWIREPAQPMFRKEQASMLDWNQVRKLRSSGLVDIESHTFDLHQMSHRGQALVRSPLVTARLRAGGGLESSRTYRRRIAADFAADRSVFMHQLGRPPRYLAWPYGAFTPEAALVARECGYKAAFTTDMGAVRRGDDLFTLPRVLLQEKDGAGLEGALLEAKYLPELSDLKTAIRGWLRPPPQ